MILSIDITRSEYVIEKFATVKVVQIFVICLALGFLEVIPRVTDLDRTLIVPLSVMVDELVYLLGQNDFQMHIVQTFSITLLAFGLAVIVGVPTGVVLWRFKILHDILEPFMLLYYAVPIFVFYPLLITIFGVNNIPILVIAWAFGIMIIISSTATGFQLVPSAYNKVGRDLNLSMIQILIYIYFPAALPYIFTGLKLGFIYSLVATIASEFILSSSGLGWYISNSYNNFAVNEMYAGIIFVIGIAIGLNSLLARIEQRLKRTTEQ